MNIAFRVDASITIGSGHVMRCLSFADALRDLGATCTFVCRRHEGHLLNVVRQRGYAVADVPATGNPLGVASEGYANWLGASWEDDARLTAQHLPSPVVDWLIVDHYALDARWERSVRPWCRHLMAIDDLADRPHDCDVLLDQNLGRTAADYERLVPAMCHLLTGPRYSLLRRQFTEWREASLARRQVPVLRRVLVSMGGIDKDNVTCEVLEALDVSPLSPECEIVVVMGACAPRLQQVHATASRLRRPAKVLVNVESMAQLMAETDLAIGAAGSTSWERCALGLPSLTTAIAENQTYIALALHRAGAAHNLDKNSRAGDIERFLSRSDLLNELTRMSSAARELTDGSGAWAVARKLFEG